MLRKKFSNKGNTNSPQLVMGLWGDKFIVS
jgi:hypothetical protein